MIKEVNVKYIPKWMFIVKTLDLYNGDKHNITELSNYMRNDLHVPIMRGYFELVLKNFLEKKGYVKVIRMGRSCIIQQNPSFKVLAKKVNDLLAEVQK